MDQSASKCIGEYLERYGWHFTKAAKGIFLTGWASELKTFPLRILEDEGFITFQVRPLAVIDQDLLEFPEILSFFLELNFHYHMAKIGIDEVGELCLTISVFKSSIDYDQFSSCLGVLALYADQLYHELKELIETDSTGQLI